ncbi:MAG: hypothetical protein IAE87_18125 [Rhodobacteraceae bacterium]|nr:hypothetical protein [Paracoccaceae bacterium]
MTAAVSAAMLTALRQAGFPGIEAEGATIYARLSASGAEFRADPWAEGWRLSLTWPLRASPRQRTGWTAAHPQAPMDLFRGETRITMATRAEAADLVAWAALAEAAVAEMIRWRHLQRAPGEGM